MPMLMQRSLSKGKPSAVNEIFQPNCAFSLVTFITLIIQLFQNYLAQLGQKLVYQNSIHFQYSLSKLS